MVDHMGEMADRITGIVDYGVEGALDCLATHRELKSRKNVTLQLLWEEYKQNYPRGYGYSWFCEVYHA